MAESSGRSNAREAGHDSSRRTIRPKRSAPLKTATRTSADQSPKILDDVNDATMPGKRLNVTKKLRNSDTIGFRASRKVSRYDHIPATTTHLDASSPFSSSLWSS